MRRDGRQAGSPGRVLLASGPRRTRDVRPGARRRHDRVERAAPDDPRHDAPLRRGGDQAQPRGARARRPAALRHPAQDDARPSASTRWRAQRFASADRAREGARRRATSARARERVGRAAATDVGDADHPDHRAVPLLPGHGDGDGRQRWASPRRRSCRKGTIAQKERWALPLLTLEKIGAWAITEPGSGSDAFGGMKSTARRDGDGYVLNGSKTFITNGPYADTIVFICKLDDGDDAEATARSLSFILDRACRGSRSRSRCARWACTPRRPASCSSRTCASAAIASSARPRTRPARSGAKETFTMERTGVAAMALGIVERVPASSRSTTPRRACSSASPIGEFQLIQLKLAQDGGGAHEHPEPRLPPDRDGGRRASR